MTDTQKQTSIVGPLNLINDNKTKFLKINESISVKCLFCDSNYALNINIDEYLAHLFLMHKFVVSDVHQIAMLPDYFNYWQNKFQENKQLDEFCTVMLLNQLPNGQPSKDEKYYLLSNDLPEDYDLRKKLQTNKLEAVLALHQFERSDQTFERGCLYCRDIIKPNRAAYIQHLFKKHFLQLGKSENLIFIDELIDELQMKLEKLICLYCEKVFKDRSTLKEHMRKKGHKRINPVNKNYDRYFLINYHQNETNSKPKEPNHKKTTTVSKNTTTFSETSKVFQSDCSDSDWSDWEGEKEMLTCLFCTKLNVDLKKFKSHLNSEHDMNFDGAMCGLTFYQKIKVINYIRRQMHDKICIYCCEKFDKIEELQNHMKLKRHFIIGKKELWNQPEYFFPTYEDDAVLFHLEDTNSIDVIDDDASIVISEESKITINEDAEALSKENLLSF